MKKRVLFVDDEVNILQGLRRMLRNMGDRWEMFFAGGGEEALDIISRKGIDIVVSDMRMPGMDGAQLMDKVMNLYPNIIRIILSGYSDQELILKSVKYTHQFLVKPCDPEVLKRTIEKACMLRELLNDEKLIMTVTGIKHLPSLPRVYRVIVEELQSSNASLKKIGDIISQDVTMTARILQLVNSAFFGLPQKVASPQQAVTLLGINTLKALILNVQVFTTINREKQPKDFSLEKLCNHSIMVGNLASIIAKSESTHNNIKEDAFAAGILHDIGILLLIENPKLYQKLMEYASVNRCSLLKAEYAVLGSSHAELGAYLLGLWGLSDPIVEAVAFHHNPSKLKDDSFTALTAVHVANAFLSGIKDHLENIDSSYLDLQYLTDLRITDRLKKWTAIFDSYKSRSLGTSVNEIFI